jgi:Rps23 Pro-64 3,4-dihydroxylase Tpa1-like proline 4-hydroxylase
MIPIIQISASPRIHAAMINYERINADLPNLHRRWTTAAPFPHVVIKDFLQDGMCQDLAGGFHEVLFGRANKDPNAEKKHRNVLKKIGTSNPAIMTPLQQRFFEVVHSPQFVALIEKLTGISPLYADPDLNGGGLHESFPGGYLNVHVDFNFHPKTAQLRRLNLILYLNEEWEAAWNGCLELWDTDSARSRCASRLSSIRQPCSKRRKRHGTAIPIHSPVPKGAAASRSRCTTTRRGQKASNSARRRDTCSFPSSNSVSTGKSKRFFRKT